MGSSRIVRDPVSQKYIVPEKMPEVVFSPTHRHTCVHIYTLMYTTPLKFVFMGLGYIKQTFYH